MSAATRGRASRERSDALRQVARQRPNLPLGISVEVQAPPRPPSTLEAIMDEIEARGLPSSSLRWIADELDRRKQAKPLPTELCRLALPSP